MIEVFFDGSSKNNGPNGFGAYSYLIKQDGKVAFSASHTLGYGYTNNQAEYHGALDAIFKANRLFPGEEKTLIGDSKLVINQLSGEWKCRDASLLVLYRQCKAHLGGEWKFKWVSRSDNAEANALCGGKD